MRKTYCSWIGIASSVFCLQVFADSSVSIQSVQANGSGCPSGSVSATLSPDNQTFSIIFDRYQAEIGKGTPAPINRLNCSIDVEIAAPDGWMFSFLSADYRGFADVDTGAAAVYEASVFFQGNAGVPAQGRRGFPPPFEGGFHPGRPGGFGPNRTQRFDTKVFQGPYSGDYLIHHDAGPNVVWSSCNHQSARRIRINTDLTARVMLMKNRILPHSLITLDTVDGSVAQSYGIQWKECVPDSGRGPHGGPNPI